MPRDERAIVVVLDPTIIHKHLGLEQGIELLNDQELVAHPGAKGLDRGVYKSDPGSMWKVPRSDLAQRIFWPTMWTEDG
jgi:hypothetical protein